MSFTDRERDPEYLHWAEAHKREDSDAGSPGPADMGQTETVLAPARVASGAIRNPLTSRSRLLWASDMPAEDEASNTPVFNESASLDLVAPLLTQRVTLLQAASPSPPPRLEEATPPPSGPYVEAAESDVAETAPQDVAADNELFQDTLQLLERRYGIAYKPGVAAAEVKKEQPHFSPDGSTSYIFAGLVKDGRGFVCVHPENKLNGSSTVGNLISSLQLNSRSFKTYFRKWKLTETQVGLSQIPKEPDDEFALDARNGYRDVGSFMAASVSNIPAPPARDSPELRQLKQSISINDDAPVYILYFFHKDEIQEVSGPSTGENTVGGTAPGPLGPTKAYLDAKFHSFWVTQKAVAASAYCVTYKHFQFRRTVITILEELGMTWKAQGWPDPVQVQYEGTTLSVGHAEVITWLPSGPAVSSFRNYYRDFELCVKAIGILDMLVKDGEILSRQEQNIHKCLHLLFSDPRKDIRIPPEFQPVATLTRDNWVADLKAITGL
ncbi:hypothetical protein C8J57DRAFT_1651421 [Mycena rebaudengoi]|nr:hypothetical protein C8J57DRAFT_1651421 [Mycena rebaudengoi]